MQRAMSAPLATDNLLFAVPKKGRLHEKCMQLIEGAGLDYKRPDRVDVAICNTLPVTIPLPLSLPLAQNAWIVVGTLEHHLKEDSSNTILQVTLVFLPAADIATYVGEGNVDIGACPQSPAPTRSPLPSLCRRCSASATAYRLVQSSRSCPESPSG